MTESAALRNVRVDLGDNTAELFSKATTIGRTHTEDTDKLSAATEIFVGILNAVPQEKTKSAGYAEVLLAYGKVLLDFTRRAGQDENILGGDVEAEVLKTKAAVALKIKAKSALAAPPTEKSEAVPKAPHLTKKALDKSESASATDKNSVEDADTAKAGGETAVAKTAGGEPKIDPVANVSAPLSAETMKTGAPNIGDSNGDKSKPVLDEAIKSKPEAGKPESVKEKKKDVFEKAQVEEDQAEEGEVQEDDEEEVDNETLTWEQLEHARLTFENLGKEYRQRLVDVFEALGDLLVESDQSEPAAKEYAKGIEILKERESPNLRAESHLQYNRYLALRRDSPEPALAALEESVRVFGDFISSESASDAHRETHKEISAELAVFKAALGPALARARAATAKQNGSGAVDGTDRVTNADTETITIVQPRRRVRKLAEVEGPNLAAEGAPQAKKARISDDTGAEEGESSNQTGATLTAVDSGKGAST